MALELAIISVLVGIALGLRFKILILLPAITLATIFALIIGFARGDSLGSIMLTVVILWIAVQFGYLAGIVIRAAARRRRR